MMQKLFFPGNFLSSGEEFLPGQNAFENAQGDVCSSTVGKAEFDREQMVVNVQTNLKEVRPVEAGAIVFGRVSSMTDTKLFVDVLQAENNGKPLILSGVMAVLQVSQVQNSYVKFLNDFFKAGDIIKARVSEANRFTIQLETKSSDSFGVIKAFCPQCRVPLSMVHNGFKCPKCALPAQRKFSSDYLVKS